MVGIKIVSPHGVHRKPIHPSHQGTGKLKNYGPGSGSEMNHMAQRKLTFIKPLFLMILDLMPRECLKPSARRLRHPPLPLQDEGI
jgi:hypothetical protein